MDDEIFYVSVHDGNRNSWKTDPFAPMIVTRSGSLGHAPDDPGELDPGDDDGFAQLIGEWTRLVPYHR